MNTASHGDFWRSTPHLLQVQSDSVYTMLADLLCEDAIKLSRCGPLLRCQEILPGAEILNWPLLSRSHLLDLQMAADANKLVVNKKTNRLAVNTADMHAPTTGRQMQDTNELSAKTPQRLGRSTPQANSSFIGGQHRRATWRSTPQAHYHGIGGQHRRATWRSTPQAHLFVHYR